MQPILLYSTTCILLLVTSVMSATVMLPLATNTRIPKTSKVANDGLKLSLAGGLAGGLATLILYPIDAVKSLCQTRTVSPLVAIQRILTDCNSLYTGVLPAALGAIPSSAIYFGSYEYCKLLLASHTAWHKSFQHVIAAGTGNLISSAVFVPKDVLKHQMQAIQQGTIYIEGFASKGGVNVLKLIDHIYKKSGLKGFYPSYRATLMKNVPSAVIRFALYEELRLLVPRNTGSAINIWYMLPGGIASAISSAFATPFDVVKTRIASGTLPPGSPILKSIADIARKEGFRGVFAGLESRLVWGSLFGGLGLTCFETFKRLLEVESYGEEQ